MLLCVILHVNNASTIIYTRSFCQPILSVATFSSCVTANLLAEVLVVVATAASLTCVATVGLPEHVVRDGLRGGAWTTEAVANESEAPLPESRTGGDDVVSEYWFICDFFFLLERKLVAYVEDVLRLDSI